MYPAYISSQIITFLLTRPSRDVTYSLSDAGNPTGISTHTPLAGRDFIHILRPLPDIRFLLTRPSRDVTGLYMETSSFLLISTHTPLAGRDRALTAHWRSPYISTHTPLAGRDDQTHSPRNHVVISTHTPLAGRDASPGQQEYISDQFLLTRPSRDVTA